MTPTTTLPPHRARQLLHGIAALIAITAVIAGIPVLLIIIGAVPHSIPSGHQVWTTLTTHDDGQLIFGVMATGVWICWTLFTLATIQELAAGIRRHPTPHLPVLRVFQLPAGGLVGAVLLAFTTAPIAPLLPHANTTPSAPLAALSPITATAHPTPAATPAIPPTPARAEPDRRQLTYVVRRHDTLWRIAEKHLGDPLRYREIRALNPGRVGPDNTIAEHTVLLMPADATGLAHPANTAGPTPDPESRSTAGGRDASAHLAPLPDAPAHPTVVVQPATGGVHDSLWRIAERTLGDGARWPEIFALNKGHRQPDGHTFTHPNRIFPGQTLQLPTDITTLPPQHIHGPWPRQTTPQHERRSAPPRPTPAPPTDTQPGPTPPSPPATETRPAPTAPARPHARPSTPEPGFSRGSELFVGLAVASAVSAALLVARRRYRRGYRPGSGDRTDLPLAPVVYQLRMAQLHAEQTADDNNDDDVEHAPMPGPQVIGTPVPGSGRTSTFTAGLGIRDGREMALDLAGTRGLGLVGPGAAAAARALLIAALTHATNSPQPHAGVTVLVPANDLPALLGPGATSASLPAAVRVATSLDTALDTLETETLARARHSRDRHTTSRPWPAVMLVAHPDDQQRHRLQAVLDNGSTLGIAGVLLGHWQSGITAYIREDGAVATTSPGPGESLRGSRLFHLGEADTRDLLTLLHDAQPDPPHRPGDDVLGRPAQPDRTPAVPPTGQAPPVEASNAAPSRDSDLEVTAALESPPKPAATQETTDRRPPPTPTRARPAPQAQRRSSRPAATRATTTTTAVIIARNRSEDRTSRQVHITPAPTSTIDTPSRAALVPLRVTVLGPPRIFWLPEPTPTDPENDERPEREITGSLQPRTRELLVFLALHPDGASREALIGALWSDNPSARTTNSLNTALSRLRRSLATATDGTLSEIVVIGENRYRLDPTLMTADYWRFDAAVTARRAATTEPERVDAYRAVVDAYGGPLADGMSTEWIETAREAIRRDAIDAVAALAHALVADDPHQTLDLLETARAFDPHNEALYRDIMRLQERLGQYDAIPRTLTLLTTRLAEIDDHPTDTAIELAARLCQRSAHTAASPTSPITARTADSDVTG